MLLLRVILPAKGVKLELLDPRHDVRGRKRVVDLSCDSRIFRLLNSGFLFRGLRAVAQSNNGGR